MTGIIIAVITGLAFAGMAGYLLYQSRRIQYPEGDTQRFAMSATTVRLIVSPKAAQLSRSAYLSHAQRALYAAFKEWPATLQPLRGELVIHVTDKTWRGLHGIQTYATAKIGKRRVPMLVIEDSPSTRRLASLIIHETGHLLAIAYSGAPDVDETNVLVWQPVGGAGSFEARAMTRYDSL